MRFVRMTMATMLVLALGACVVAPAPYPAYGYDYGYPGYVAAPPIVVSGGWGWHGGGWEHGRRW
jgi:hypothetical protein